MVREVVEEDIADVANWDTRTRIYDENDQLLSYRVSLDSGIEVLSEYTDGIRTSLTKTDLSPDGEASGWEEVRQTYDLGGRMTRMETDFDDGRTEVRTYVDGTIRSSIQRDLSQGGLGQSWTTVQTQYDVAGVIETQNLVYDNGGRRERTFEDGQIARDLQIDGGNADWTNITTVYDAEGQREERRTFYDDGAYREETFEGGALSSIIQYDYSLSGQAEVWERIYTYYDPQTGAKINQSTLFDDGLLREEDYTDGVISLRVETDTADRAGDGGTRPWHELRTSYDGEGLITGRVQTGDDGVLQVTDYVAGLRDSYHATDAEDAFVWAEIAIDYDAEGNEVLRETVYDDGDRLIDYRDSFGARTARIEYDGDGDQSWLVRVTDYGTGVRTTYDDVADVPAIYQDQFDFLMV